MTKAMYLLRSYVNYEYLIHTGIMYTYYGSQLNTKNIRIHASVSANGMP